MVIWSPRIAKSRSDYMSTPVYETEVTPYGDRVPLSDDT